MNELTFAQKENIGFQFVLDSLQPCSPYGQQLLRQMKPMGSHQRQEIARQLSNVQRILLCRQTCKPLAQLLRVLMGMKMVRPAAIKCQSEPLNEIELFEIKRFLLQSQEIYSLYCQLQPILALEGICLQDTLPALDLLDPEKNRVASFYLPDAASPQLAALRQEKRQLELQLRQTPQEALFARRAELAGQEALEEQRIHAQLSQQLQPYLPAMLANMDAIADLDLTAEKARIAALYGGTMPRLTTDQLDMQQMINPRIQLSLQQRQQSFTPISIALSPGATVITGANMGGKSVALKTLALNILLVHCGCFPFAQAATVPLFDGLHILSEDLESIDRGLSSFGGEMVRFRDILPQLQQGLHLVILDEFARGTNPKEGAAIVRSVTRYLNACHVMAVLATHYDHVSQLANAHYQVAGLRDVDWKALGQQLQGLDSRDGARQIEKHMNYGLYPVDAHQSCPTDALNICRLLGMPEQILLDAEKTIANS